MPADHTRPPGVSHRADGDDPVPADLTYASANERKHWLDNAGNVELIVYGVYVLSFGLFLADLVVHKHAPFAIEHLFGFYAIYGFIGCVALVLVAKGMRVLLMRPEDHYDR